MILGRRKSVDTPTRRSFINYSLGWTAEGLETNMSAEKFVSSAVYRVEKRQPCSKSAQTLTDDQVNLQSGKDDVSYILRTHVRNVVVGCLPWRRHVCVVRLPNMPPLLPPSLWFVRHACDASVGEHAQKMFARQIFQTFGNPPPTCPPCMVPTHFSRFLLSDLVQT